MFAAASRFIHTKKKTINWISLNESYPYLGLYYT